MRISASATLRSIRDLRGGSSREQRAKLRLDAIEWRVEHFTARDHHHVDRDGGFVVTEQFADQALGSIAFHSDAHLTGRCNTETGRARLAFPREHRHEASGPLKPRLIDDFEVGPLPDVLCGPEASHLLLV